MKKSILWKNAQAKHKTFTITAHVSSRGEAHRLVIAAIASLVPETLSEEEGEALLNWTYEKEPVIEQRSIGIAEGEISIVKVNEQ